MKVCFHLIIEQYFVDLFSILPTFPAHPDILNLISLIILGRGGVIIYEALSTLSGLNIRLRNFFTETFTRCLSFTLVFYVLQFCSS